MNFNNIFFPPKYSALEDKTRVTPSRQLVYLVVGMNLTKTIIN